MTSIRFPQRLYNEDGGNLTPLGARTAGMIDQEIERLIRRLPMSVDYRDAELLIIQEVMVTFARARAADHTNRIIVDNIPD